MTDSSSTSRRFVFFGDSICFGQGISIHHGWVPRISQRFEEIGQRHGEDIVVVNASVNGNTTRQALERMPYEVQSHGVDLLIVQFGMNDCNYWQTDRGVPRVSARAFAANLVEIVQRGFAFGARLVLLHTNHPTLRSEETMAHAGVTYEQSNRAYNEIIREVASEFGPEVLLTDVEAYFDARTEAGDVELGALLLPDHLHLSLTGHDLYFELMEQSLLPRVESAFWA